MWYGGPLPPFQSHCKPSNSLRVTCCRRWRAPLTLSSPATFAFPASRRLSLSLTPPAPPPTPQLLPSSPSPPTPYTMLTAKSPLHTPPRPIATYRGTTPTQYSEVSNYIDKGEVHPPEFRDPIFALFFLAMLLAILICSVVYTPSFLAANELSYSIHAPTAAFFQIALLQAASCVALVVGSLTLMMAFTEVLIKGCLIGSIGVNVAAR